jgi:hypothetical protein
MIQRKQTLFLLVSVVLLVASAISLAATVIAPIVLGIAALVSVATIFLYKQRKLQATICLVIMLVIVGWYVILAVSPQPDGSPQLLGWAHVLPMVSLILTFMARKGILADEKLVRSLDRIR